ncbi:MAG: mechanosensitive ion channel family protein [Cyanobacteriota bacterium]
MLVELTNNINETTGLSHELQWKIIISVGIFVFSWLLQYLVSVFLANKLEDPKIRYRWKKTGSYTIYALGIFIIIGIWFDGIKDLATFVGLVSAGMAVAMKEPLENLAGWGFILWRKPFEVGDRIQLGDYKGDVIDQRLFMFTLMEVGNWVQEEQSTGRIINIPNGLIFTQVLANYNKGFNFLWNEIPVLVTFESDWEKALEILDEIANKHTVHLTKQAEQNIKKAAENFMIFYSYLTPKVYLSVVDSGVLLTIRYLCEIKRRRGSAEEIWKDILKEFAKHDNIDFAYPTQRAYYNPIEGKNGTKPSKTDISISTIVKDFLNPGK